MTNPNESAFAKSAYISNEGVVDPPQEGLTKREYFAAMAMQGLISFGWNVHEYDKCAKNAIKAADALIKSLNL